MNSHHRFARWLAGLGTACLFAAGSVAAHADAGSLHSKYDELKPQLQHNAYGRPLVIDSSEGSNTLQGEVYAVVDAPYDKVRQALQDPGAWCDIMLLPFNTKACQAGGGQLHVRIGRKATQPVDQAYPLDLSFQRAASGADYMETRLSAGQGPFGTHDYRILAEAVPLESGRTFVHMSYGYGFGGGARFAMNAFLATAGANKAGFTAGGMRGAIERNAMRYYLAIDAYLHTMDVPGPQRVEQRVNRWFAETERYPRQLHEMDHDTYVSMKLQEYGQHQQTAAAE
jgi:hypothetical protein